MTNCIAMDARLDAWIKYSGVDGTAMLREKRINVITRRPERECGAQLVCETVALICEKKLGFRRGATTSAVNLKEPKLINILGSTREHW